MEKWKKIRGWPYLVSDEGRVKSLDRIVMRRGPCPQKGRILKPGNCAGYRNVILCRHNGDRRRTSVHTLVAEAFLGKRPRGKNVNHIDSDRSNNRVENLEWATQKENIHHCMAAGRRRYQHGSTHWNSKLNEELVLKIRKELTNCYWGKRQALAAKYNVSGSTIGLIKQRKIWRHI